ncbi:MAG: c-type cytochrome [Pseudomonadota bacterium]
MNRALRRCFAILAMALGFGLFSPLAALAEGDGDRGKVLAYTCLGCHGIDGYRNAYPSYRVPMLGGQSDAYIQVALKAYRSGEREHATMRAQAASLSDADIADLAAYFTGLGAADIEESSSPAPEKAALCTACHGANGVGVQPEWPTLSGQHEDYLVNSLLQYQGATVNKRNNAVMAGIVTTLTEKDIRELAAYYASFGGLYTTLGD